MIRRFFATAEQVVEKKLEEQMGKRLEEEAQAIVIRTDLHGNNYLVREDLTPEQAKKIADDFNATGHKQFFQDLPNNTTVKFHR